MALITPQATPCPSITVVKEIGFLTGSRRLRRSTTCQQRAGHLGLLFSLHICEPIYTVGSEERTGNACGRRVGEEEKVTCREPHAPDKSANLKCIERQREGEMEG